MGTPWWLLPLGAQVKLQLTRPLWTPSSLSPLLPGAQRCLHRHSLWRSVPGPHCGGLRCHPLLTSVLTMARQWRQCRSWWRIRLTAPSGECTWGSFRLACAGTTAVCAAVCAHPMRELRVPGAPACHPSAAALKAQKLRLRGRQQQTPSVGRLAGTASIATWRWRLTYRSPPHHRDPYYLCALKPFPSVANALPKHPLAGGRGLGSNSSAETLLTSTLPGARRWPSWRIQR
jgi:hypothetical protein